MGRSGGKKNHKNKAQVRGTFSLDPNNLDIVHSKAEWDKRKEEGTLHPDGKTTVIRKSEEDFAKILEDRDRVARGEKPKHSTPPKPGDKPPWAR